MTCDNKAAAHSSKRETVKGFGGAALDLLHRKFEDELEFVGQRKYMAATHPSTGASKKPCRSISEFSSCKA